MGRYGVDAIQRWRDDLGPWFLRRSGENLFLIGTSWTPDLGTAGEWKSNRQSWIANFPVPTQKLPEPFPGDMLDKSASFTPSVSFRERYEEFIVTYTEPGIDYGDGLPEPPRVRRVPAGRWSAAITVKASIAGLDLGSIGPDTPVQLFIGDFVFRKTLGESLDWGPGKRKATFTLSHARLIVTWTSDVVTYAMTGAAADRLGFEPADQGLPAFHYVERFDRFSLNWIGFPHYLGRYPGSPNAFRQNFQKVIVAFGDRTGAREVVRGGITGSKTQADNTLRTIEVTGLADYTAPAIAILDPPANAVTYSPEIAIRVKTFATGIFLRVNGGSWTLLDSDIPGGFADVTGTFAYYADWSKRPTGTKVALAPGQNLIEIKAMDASGNESAPAARRVTYSTLGGGYSGLIRANETIAGYFALSTNVRNTFTGRVIVGANSYAVSGSFAPDGSATIPLLRGRVAVGSLTLQATVPTDGRTTIAGSVSLDSAQYSLEGGRDKSFPASGSWALSFPASASMLTDAAMPKGAGFALLKVSQAGARTAGRMADGTPFSFSGLIDAHGRFPIYAALKYSKTATGLLTGTAELQGLPAFPRSAAGSFVWSKPATPVAARFPQAFTVPLSCGGGLLARIPFGAAPPAVAGPAKGRIVSGTTILLEKAVSYQRGRIVVTQPGQDRMALRFAGGIVSGTVKLPGEAKPSSIFSVATSTRTTAQLVEVSALA